MTPDTNVPIFFNYFLLCLLIMIIFLACLNQFLGIIPNFSLLDPFKWSSHHFRHVAAVSNYLLKEWSLNYKCRPHLLTRYFLKVSSVSPFPSLPLRFLFVFRNFPASRLGVVSSLDKGETHAPRNPRPHRWNLGTKAARALSRLMLIRLGFTSDFDEHYSLSPISPYAYFGEHLMAAYGQISFILSLVLCLTYSLVTYLACSHINLYPSNWSLT